MLLVPLNGHWGRWADWSACSTTCGKGYQTRSRMCDDPPPQFGGNICEGVLVQTQMCKGNRPECKSSNKVTGPSKWSVPLGCYRSAVFPQFFSSSSINCNTQKRKRNYLQRPTCSQYDTLTLLLNTTFQLLYFNILQVHHYLFIITYFHCFQAQYTTLIS